MPIPSEALLNNIVAEIRKAYKAKADPAIVTKYSRYFKEGYIGYGVSSEDYREIEEGIVKKYGEQLGLEGFLALGDLLMQGKMFEENTFAYHVLLTYKTEFTKATFLHITKWLEGGIKNWGHCDSLCGGVLIEFYTKKIVTTTDLAGWVKAKSQWKRRALPVSLITFLKKLKVPVKELLPLVEPLMMDEERVVHQGLGWFLREAWKVEPKPVEALLLQWKDKSARLIFQYATEKMTKEQKERYKKG